VSGPLVPTLLSVLLSIEAGRMPFQRVRSPTDRTVHLDSSGIMPVSVCSQVSLRSKRSRVRVAPGPWLEAETSLGDGASSEVSRCRARGEAYPFWTILVGIGEISSFLISEESFPSISRFLGIAFVNSTIIAALIARLGSAGLSRFGGERNAFSQV